MKNKFTSPKKERKRLLLIKVDAIGDYILFRNFLEVVRASERYRGYHVTLCGNKLWKNIAECYDREFVDDFLWMDLARFSASRLYRYFFFLKLLLKRFDEVVSPTFSRRFYVEDTIVKWARAAKKVGSNGDLNNMTYSQKLKGNRFYTELIEGKADILFEFYRNKEFFSNFLAEHTISLQRPILQAGKAEYHSEYDDYIVICPGAGAGFRCWSPLNYARLCEHILERHKTKILLCGSNRDNILAKEIIDNTKGQRRIANKCGKTSLTELISIIRKATLLIANDSSAIHIAAATKVNAICISNGNHFGRFHPYPEEISKAITTVYPSAIAKLLDAHIEEIAEKHIYSSSEDINGIQVADIIRKIEKYV